ncbi:hypothetical protein COU19_03030 [Candidatus Kaiserbacteria bacterium CG10_big_fil_rev_8_21_14_0_10_56_12]|uniref:GNAT family N-acetyltransferase n=1 Tax=Candidatus Kaiserbacteria bacterium CG10_big_fil_rev_8_21_14_0_10_56_12 TaxID=1974611 RepID=A0A2H0U985_9BACT|nr:MAG: hypothetical protein COU19_03030 [Candidatus Kaiserbacteria bacterium CG10_big_fil_rev_8_21_14_0_10_56_12]
MSSEGSRSCESRPELVVELYDWKVAPWSSVREDIMRIDRLCLGRKAFSESDLRTYFEDRLSIVVLLRRENRIIGYCAAAPD